MHAQAWDALHPEYAKWRRKHGWPKDAYERIGINREVLQAIRIFRPELNSEDRKKLARDIIRRSYFGGKGRWKLAAETSTGTLLFIVPNMFRQMTSGSLEGIMAFGVLPYALALTYTRAMLIGASGHTVPWPRKKMFVTPSRKTGHRGIVIHEASHVAMGRTVALSPLASAAARLEELRRPEKLFQTKADIKEPTPKGVGFPA